MGSTEDGECQVGVQGMICLAAKSRPKVAAAAGADWHVAGSDANPAPFATLTSPYVSRSDIPHATHLVMSFSRPGSHVSRDQHRTADLRGPNYSSRHDSRGASAWMVGCHCDDCTLPHSPFSTVLSSCSFRQNRRGALALMLYSRHADQLFRRPLRHVLASCDSPITDLQDRYRPRRYA